MTGRGSVLARYVDLARRRRPRGGLIGLLILEAMACLSDLLVPLAVVS